MTTSFKKTLIAASVGAVLAAGSFSAIAGTAGTTNLLFPFITTEAGAFTFISISNQNAAVTGAANNYHFTYATKAAGAANSASCAHLDGDATATANDLMQFEVSNKVAMTQFGGTSAPKFFPSNQAPQRGFLIVNNDAAANGTYGGGNYNSARLYGEARIINTSTGLAAGYSTDDLHTVAAANPDFTNAAGPDGGTAGNNKVISWFPDSAATTSFYMLPLGTEQSMAFGTTSLSATYQAQSSTATSAALGAGGHYNNKEGFQSSIATAPVTCLGTFSRADLLGTLNAPFSANGGWANFRPTTVSGNSIPALVYKLETTTALGGTTSFITRAPIK